MTVLVKQEKYEDYRGLFKDEHIHNIDMRPEYPTSYKLQKYIILFILVRETSAFRLLEIYGPRIV